MALVEVKIPDIGDFDEVAVIELLVKVGDTVKVEQSLITVESDKASMEIPSSTAGVVKELRVAMGDKVKQGSVVLVVEAAGAAAAPVTAPAVAAPVVATPSSVMASVAKPSTPGPINIHVPNIGDFKDVAVIEVFVKPGDTIKVEQSLITVESDKASMEIPSSHAGVLKEIKVKVGDKINIGDLLAILDGAASAAAPVTANAAPVAATAAPVMASAAKPSMPDAGLPRADGPRHDAAPVSSAPAHAPGAPSLGHLGPATRLTLGPQVRSRTGRSAGRSQRPGHQRPHHRRRCASLHQGRHVRHSPDQGPGGQGTCGFGWRWCSLGSHSMAEG
ncbi:MAG: Dihydrolipoyllysine-residue acetyltransferase component of pyruvate dehydrogenase complex [Pseudomonadota bacterium]